MKVKRIFIIIVVIVLLGIIGLIGFNFKNLTYGYGVINNNEEVIIDFKEYDNIEYKLSNKESNIIQVEDNGSVFYINLDNGEELFNNMEITDFSEGYARVYNDSYTYFIDKNGKRVSNNFEDAGPFKNGMAKVKSNGKWGIIDKNWNIILDCKYDGIDGVYKNNGNLTSIVSLNNKWGLVDRYGNIIVDFKYDFIFGFDSDSNLASMMLDGKWGVLNEKGEVLIEPKYENQLVLDGENEIIYCFEDKQWTIKDLYENVLVTYEKNNEVYVVNEDKIIINKVKSGLIDRKGNYIIDLKYEDIQLAVNYEKSELYIAKLNNKYGVIDENEKIIIDFIYDEIEDGTNGIFKVNIKNKGRNNWGLIDIENKRTIKCQYDYLDKIKYNLYEVGNWGGQNWLIDIDEKVIAEKGGMNGAFSNIKKTDYIGVRSEDWKFGIIDIDGNEIIKCKYNSTLWYGNGEYFVIEGYNKLLVIIYSLILLICSVLVINLTIKIFRKRR